jgi:hypothetical protein
MKVSVLKMQAVIPASHPTFGVPRRALGGATLCPLWEGTSALLALFGLEG